MREVFLPRDAMLARYMLSCVRPSVKSRHCTKIAKRSMTQATPYDNPGTSFLLTKTSAKFNGVRPNGAPNSPGV